jgi:arylsulfatase A-like enzyme
MPSFTVLNRDGGPTGSPSLNRSASRSRIVLFVVLSAWCGLCAGLGEVLAIAARKRVFEPNHLYWMPRHFVWLIPLLDLAIFVFMGVLLLALVAFGRGRGEWLATRLVAALTVLVVIWAAFPRIYGAAGVVLSLGIAARLVPALERHADLFWRLVRVILPIVAALVIVLAASFWGADRLEAWREAKRPLPPAGAPNVLLIVLDTVGARHLSLHGYKRPTSPTLEELAARGVRFDRAQSTSSWTLPSHASLFTGRWPHELSVGWLSPLDGRYPTLAEFLKSRGYSTAGFVANSWYCGSDSGLARGFTAYEDHTFPRLTAFKTTVLVNRVLEGIEEIERWLEDWLDFDWLSPATDRLWWMFQNNRKDAAEVNREFLDWLSRRSQPERPFFAFLNFYDAHYPYELPPKRLHRFGARPRNLREANLLRDWLQLVQEGPSERQIGVARDAYDDSLADLDEQLGRLIDELDSRSVLDRTWLIITSDHGESFGEQQGVFWHGTSLYQAQVHVPLVMVPTAGGPSPRVVTETVSLRDLPATIVDFLGSQARSPFPGKSLARFWGGSTAAPVVARGPHFQAVNFDRPADHGPGPATLAPVLSEVVPIQSFDRDPSQWLEMPRWPMAALTIGDWTYIRREGNVREELFHWPEDAREQHNRAGDRAAKLVLEHMRTTLRRLTAGPLTPQRFSP